MKITIYTIKDCEFSKQEKDYLTAKNLPFEEKDLEVNREYLTEMLTVSNNFSGTPVTKIDKDDGQISVLKGFTKEEFDKIFAPADVKPAEAVPPAAPQAEPPLSAAQTPPPPPTTDIPQTPPAPEPTEPASPNIDQPAPAPPLPTPPAPGPAVTTVPTDAQLNSILSDLQKKAGELPDNSAQAPANGAVPPATPPAIPDYPHN